MAKVSIYFSIFQSGGVYYISQKNILQQPNGKSILLAKYGNIPSTASIVAEYMKLFNKLGFKGLVMIELRKRNNNYYMIEANPRFWGPSQLFCDMGYNFFEFMMLDYGIIEYIPSAKMNLDALYLWSGGIDENYEKCMYLGSTEEFNIKNLNKYKKIDIYNRPDTIKLYEVIHEK